MDEDRILEELIALLEKQAIPVKYDRGNFKGGLIRYHDEQVFYLNRKEDTATRINLIVQELTHIDFSLENLSKELYDFLKDRNVVSRQNSVQIN